MVACQEGSTPRERILTCEMEKTENRAGSGVWLLLLALCTAVTLAGAPAYAQQKPNIILILSDACG